MKIAVIFPHLPPRLDGIGDYTALFSAELAKTEEVTLLTGCAPEIDPIQNVRIQTVFSPDQVRDTTGMIYALQSEAPDWALLQYNPFCYGRKGYHPELVQALQRFKQNCTRTRLAVMFHETFVPPWPWKHTVFHFWQKPQFLKICACADAAFFSIDRWTEQYRPLFHGAPAVHLPVGSNIPRVPADKRGIREKLQIPQDAIVIGMFSVSHAPYLMKKIRATLDQMARAGRKVLFYYVGRNHELMQQALQGLPLRAETTLASSEVSLRLGAMDLLFAPYLHGVSTRNGAFIAGLQHGLPTLCTPGNCTDPLLRNAEGEALVFQELGASELTQAVVRLLCDDRWRETVGANAEQLYLKHFDWSVIATRFLSTLRESSVS